MTLETFFEKFELFADAPDAVAKMRELVLELAVRGKLSERRTADQDDPAWGEFTDELDHRVYGSDPGAPPPFEIPEEWRWSQIDEAAAPCRQKTPDEVFTYIDVGSINNQRGSLKDVLEVLDPSAAPSRARKLVAPACVIYATVRPYLKNIAIIDREISPAPIVSTAFAVLNPKAFIESRFLFYWLRSTSFEREVNAYAKGVAYPAINDGDFRSCPMPVPPPAEQKRIVAKVDELMALCDRLALQQEEGEIRRGELARASLARFADAPTPANLNLLFHSSFIIPPSDLRKSILTLAVQGKLVPQDPNDEQINGSLDALLKAERKNPKWAGPIEEDEQPNQLPPSWKWVRLGDVCSLKHGYAFSSEHFTSDPAPFVLTTPGNFYEKGGFRDRESKRKYYTGPVDPEFIFEPADLIIPMTEQAAGLLGSPAFIPDDGRVYIHNQRLGKLSFTEVIAPEFAFWFFNSDYFRGELARTCTGMKVRHTSPDRILKVLFPVGPLAEQRRIVAKVDELMALVDALQTQLATARTTATALLAAAVAELTTTEAIQDVERKRSGDKIIPIYQDTEEDLLKAAESAGRYGK